MFDHKKFLKGMLDMELVLMYQIHKTKDHSDPMGWSKYVNVYYNPTSADRQYKKYQKSGQQGYEEGWDYIVLRVRIVGVHEGGGDWFVINHEGKMYEPKDVKFLNHPEQMEKILEGLKAQP